MQSGDRVFSVSAYTDNLGVPRHYMSEVTLVDLDAEGRALVETDDGSRWRLLRSQGLAATKADAKLMAAQRLEEMARPFHDLADKLRQEAVALAASEQVVTA